MKNLPWNILVLLLLPLASWQRSDPSSTTYIGGVVEYSPIRHSEESLGKINADNYLKFIRKAAEYDVDILVFPESSLSIPSSKNWTISRTESASYVPDPNENIVPCEDDNTYSYSLRSISCAAKQHQIYVVINHHEKVDCSGENCSADGFHVYNTNIAFDRSGRVIARYRKYNLFGERGINRTSEPIPSTFDTDFGVTFGQFICFDILFQTPTLNLTRYLGITDIIYSTHWFSELPFLYSVQAQAGWAYSNNVNFLASGYNNPNTASQGTGIYMGRKGYVHVLSEDKASNTLIVSEIPKILNGKYLQNINREKLRVHNFSNKDIPTTEHNGTGRYIHKIDNLIPYTTELIDTKQSIHNKILCDREFCCKFQLKLNFNESLLTSENKYYRYRLAIFNGTRTFDGVATGGVKICGIISCINENIDGCGKLHDFSGVMPTNFESINISTQSISNQNTFFMPVTLSRNIIPLNTTDYSYSSIDLNETSSYFMNLTHSRNDLLTFALYGRYFAADGTNVTRSLTSGLSAFSLLSLLTVSLIVTYSK